jgi:2-keto-4-pentenoate hydratase/2-oxohepta-3-ene-1,7-dioic acid hydratase in catechol pathway
MNVVMFGNREIQPSKVVCIGRNYVDHIKELGNDVPAEPVIFMKPNSAISTDLRSNLERNLQYEAEISFIVESGRLAGVGFGLDLTGRNDQTRLKSAGLPWERAKAFDGSAVFSEFVSVKGELADLRISLDVNGTTVQEGGCHLMIHQPNDILDEVGTFLTMEDGDILMTGTPAGVGVVSPGDDFSGKIFVPGEVLVERTWRAI